MREWKIRQLAKLDPLSPTLSLREREFMGQQWGRIHILYMNKITEAGHIFLQAVI